MRSYFEFKTLRKNLLIAVAAVIIGIALVIYINSSATTVYADTEDNYTLTSIEVMNDDSLWSIASKYCPEDVDTQEYISMIQEINNISSDYIVEGNYLIIPVYE